MSDKRDSRVRPGARESSRPDLSGDLAAIVAHEIRNPLAIISNALVGLRRKSLREEDRDTLLDIIGEETQRLERLVADFLTYARPFSVHLEAVPLRLAVERSIARCKKLGPAGITFTNAIGEGTVAPVDVDMLARLLDNLLENAAVAMAGEGTIRVMEQDFGDHDAVGFVVADTGPGMNREVLEQATQPFFTTRPTGSGLGLALVSRIVRAHGGWLQIESEPGAGTRVHVAFPKVDASIGQSTPPLGTPATSRG